MSRAVRRSKHPKLVKGILKGGIVLLATTFTVAAIYSAVHFTKTDKVDGALGNDFSSSVVGENGEKKDPIEIIDSNGKQYEIIDIQPGETSDGQMHDQDGENDPNRYEKDDPFGTFSPEQKDEVVSPDETPAEGELPSKDALEDSDSLIAIG